MCGLALETWARTFLSQLQGFQHSQLFMRISRAVIVLLAVALVTVVRHASSSVESVVLAVIVPAYLGGAFGLLAWLAVLYHRRRSLGDPWKTQTLVGVTSVAAGCTAIACFLVPRLPASAPITMLGAATAMLTTLVLLAAQQFGWDRHPRW